MRVQERERKKNDKVREGEILSQPTLQWEGKAKKQRCGFQKGEHVGVTTNVYSRKTLEKTP